MYLFRSEIQPEENICVETIIISTGVYIGVERYNNTLKSTVKLAVKLAETRRITCTPYLAARTNNHKQEEARTCYSAPRISSSTRRSVEERASALGPVRRRRAALHLLGTSCVRPWPGVSPAGCSAPPRTSCARSWSGASPAGCSAPPPHELRLPLVRCVAGRLLGTSSARAVWRSLEESPSAPGPVGVAGARLICTSFVVRVHRRATAATTGATSAQVPLRSPELDDGNEQSSPSWFGLARYKGTQILYLERISELRIIVNLYKGEKGQIV